LEANKVLQNMWNWPIKEAGPRVLETLATPDRNAPLEETQMADYSNIGLRDDSASVEKSDNWKSIGELARNLAEKAAAGAK
jgi:hypothetical protein